MNKDYLKITRGQIHNFFTSDLERAQSLTYGLWISNRHGTFTQLDRQTQTAVIDEAANNILYWHTPEIAAQTTATVSMENVCAPLNACRYSVLLIGTIGEQTTDEFVKIIAIDQLGMILSLNWNDEYIEDFARKAMVNVALSSRSPAVREAATTALARLA